MKKVLIICTGNSCRSIMAEALINHYLGDEWQAFSAGTHPSRVHPYAINALQEIGVATEGLCSQSISEYLHRQDIDLVITVCDGARARCPVWPAPAKQIHMSFADPVNYTARSFDEDMRGFRVVRDEIIKDLLPLLQEEDA